MDTHYGIKKLTLENWLQTDPATASFFRIDPELQPIPIEGKEWFEYFSSLELSESVPDEVCKLFDVARGCLCYGYFFYPLFTLGLEQVFRVLEAAVMLRCHQMSAPAGVKSYMNGVEWLLSKNAIAREEDDRWRYNVGMRNLASHPQGQSILPPTVVKRMVEGVMNNINALFVLTT
jgi:hypothetical protein